MKTFLTALLLAASPFVLAGETVDLWLCPGDVYTDRPCAAGQRMWIDASSNLMSAETRRPSAVDDRSGPSVLVIPRPKPARFEPPSPSQGPTLYGPSGITVNIAP